MDYESGMVAAGASRFKALACRACISFLSSIRRGPAVNRSTVPRHVSLCHARAMKIHLFQSCFLLYFRTSSSVPFCFFFAFSVSAFFRREARASGALPKRRGPGWRTWRTAWSCWRRSWPWRSSSWRPAADAKDDARRNSKLKTTRDVHPFRFLP